MREIKFRAWDCIKKEMQEVKVLELPLFETTFLMQFTGLKDKNGKEIYEGDVIEFGSIDAGVPLLRLPVVWNEKACGFYCSNGSTSRGVDMAAGYDTISGEVIGNIYETPALVAPTK